MAVQNPFSYIDQYLPQNIEKARAEYNRIMHQPWENAPTRGTALKEYGGAYFGVPGLSPSAVEKPAGGWRAYQSNVSKTPGAGLAVLGIDPRDPNAEAKAKAWIEYNRPRGTGLWQEGAWGEKFGREDARVPGFAAMKRQYPKATDAQLLDAVMRQHYGQSALPPRTFDIADVLVPVGEIALGALTGGPWASMALGGIHGGVNNGLLGGVLGAAGGYGGGNFGADIVSQGVGGALGNQISGVKDFLTNPVGTASSAVPTTPTGALQTAANVASNVPSSMVLPSNTNTGIASVLPPAAFGAQAAGAFRPSTPTPSRPVTPVTPTPTNTTKTPVMTPKLNVNPSIVSAIQNRFGPSTTGARPMGPTTPTAPRPIAGPQPNRFASGGMLPTSKTEMNPMGGAPAAAYGLASFGRGPDTTLVHMSQPEVAALQQLAQRHGGSLTTNPTTGLPEAGFLSSILPAIVGIGATLAAPFTGGGSLAAFLGSPLAMGLTAGGIAGLVSGDPREALKWGLGIGGGAGLGQGLMGLGANAAAGAGTQVPGLMSGVTPAAAEFAGVGGAVPTTAGTAAGTAAGAGAGTAAGAGALGQLGSNVSNLGSGAMQALKGNWTGFDPGMGGLIGTGGRGLAGAMGAAVLAPMALTPPDPLKIQQPKSSYPPYGGPYIWTGGPNGQLQQMNTGQVVYDIPSYGARPSASYPYGYAQGGVAELAQDSVMKKGGYLDGPGDGMSDSIPATIEDKQPARLADGEFVIPADVVSHIGNGSSKAGAKRLYAMMDRIRHARTGNKKQGKEINPDKYLPA